MSIDIEDLRSRLRAVSKTGHFWLAVFVVCLIAANGAFFASVDSTFFNMEDDKDEILVSYDPEPGAYDDGSVFSFGGPVSSGNRTGTTLDLASVSSLPKYSSASEEGDSSFVYAGEALAVGASYPYSNVIPDRQGLKKYKVGEGDTLSEIAAKFGITLETVKYANLDVGSVISPGDELVILPVSGILYRIEEEDTLEIVTSRYRVNPALIEKYNPEYQKLFESPGEMVILPYAKPLNRWSYTNLYKENLPKLENYFTLPAVGWNWGELHYYNAVDIAAACGETVYASAEGLVVEESDINRWNDGYGNYIVIEHPNRTRTRYGHLQDSFVNEGDYVLQGEEIATIGNTGNTHGPTGCHLHFEVHGAENPFAVK